MPQEELYDIWFSDKRVPIDQLPAEHVYDTNSGLGFTREAARTHLAMLNSKERNEFGEIKGMGLHYLFSMKMRDFDKIPKCCDTNEWGDEDGEQGRDRDPIHLIHFDEESSLPIPLNEDKEIVWPPPNGYDADALYNQTFCSLDEIGDLEEEPAEEE